MTASTIASAVALPKSPSLSNLEDHWFCSKEYMACLWETHCPTAQMPSALQEVIVNFVNACNLQDMMTLTEGSKGIPKTKPLLPPMESLHVCHRISNDELIVPFHNHCDHTTLCNHHSSQRPKHHCYCQQQCR